MSRARVGVVGARGHVGAELLPLLLSHGQIEVAWVTSRTAAGAPIPGTALSYVAADPAVVLRAPVDAIVLALPNGESGPWVEAGRAAILVDLSSDHRFDPDWTYGQPERFRRAIRGARRIASPGCYATAAQLCLAPLVPLLAGAAHVYGISGYSGAGTTPSERNDPEVLRDNVLPYALVGHAHERELVRHLGAPVYFMPHVAPFFRGLLVTVSATLAEPAEAPALRARFADAYGGEPFVRLLDRPPRPRDATFTHAVAIGGLDVGDGGRHVVLTGALDNLLGGAASQAIRALNLALGLAEDRGLAP